MTQQVSYAAELGFAHELADYADQISMDRFGAVDLKVERKADFTLVSDADKAVEDKLRALLADSGSTDSILGEERGRSGEATRQWIIDPIDGTNNFVRGVPVWATLIALAQEDEVVLGVVSAPALGRRWWAAKGTGAYVQVQDQSPQQIAVSRVCALGDAFMAYSSLQGWQARGLLDNFLALQDSCWRSRGFGDFWSYMMVAEGVVDFAAEPELELYDMAALVPIVQEAGGQFTSSAGKPGPWGADAVASNGQLHQKVLEALKIER